MIEPFDRKAAKLIKKVNPEDSNECVDVDRLIEMLVEEYFEAKKKNFRILGKNFAKFYESDHGLLSFEDVKSIVAEVTDVESPVPGSLYANEFTKLRLFLYALTSSKNKYDILNKDFLLGCSKFGVDTPFPFLSLERSGLAEKPLFAEINELNRLKSSVVATAQELSSRKVTQQGRAAMPSRSEIPEEDLKRGEKKGKTLEEIDVGKEKAGLKLDASSSMFAQHFSILRELRHYCLQLKDVVKNESELDVVWKHIDNIINILEVGCQFLNFPIQIS